VAWSVARRREAWRAWAFFADGVMVNALVVGLTRIGAFTPKHIAYTVYYNLEITFLFFITAAVAFFGRREARRERKLRAPAQVVAAVGLSSSLAFSWWGAAHLSTAEVWPGRRSRAYLDRAAAGLEQLRRSGQPVALVDGIVPYAVVPYLLVPYNSHSEVLPLLDERVTFDASGRELFRVTYDGTPLPVAFQPATGGEVLSLLAANALAVSPPRLEFGDEGLCVSAGSTETVVGYTPPTPLTGGPWYLSLRYAARRGKLLALAAEPIGGGPPRRTRLVTLPGGREVTTVYFLDATELQRVYLVLSSRAELCLKALAVGRLVSR
jgi:hypothetical protein